MFPQPEQKQNRITNAHCYSVRPTCTKPNVISSASYSFFVACCIVLSIIFGFVAQNSFTAGIAL